MSLQVFGEHSFTWLPAVLGLMWAVGLLLIRSAISDARPSLARRVAEVSFPSSNRHAGPPRWIVSGLLRFLGTIGSTTSSVCRRLTLLGTPDALPAFRLRQSLCALAGMVIALSALTPLLVRLGLGTGSALVAFFSVFIGGAVGAGLADSWLGWRAKTRQKTIEMQVPDVSELLALSIAAGESVPDALERVGTVCSGPIRQELGIVFSQIRLGVPTTKALSDLVARNESAALERLAHTLITAIERGAPLAQVLHDQARDTREGTRSALMEEGGKREIAMMVPVVFLILPVTVLFALFPGLTVISFSP